MYKIKKKAFTLIELIIVVTIIGILVMATTVYLSGTDEKRKIIEAQGCANTLGGEINNFVFYALTSKNLKVDENSISPSVYIINLTGCETTDSGTYCNKINLSYDTGNNYNTYKDISTNDICHQTKLPLLYYWSGENSTGRKVKMNKGFSQTNLNNKNIFYIEKNGQNDISLSGDVITATCFDKNCQSKKEIGKFIVDGRSQTISRRNCKFYNDEDQFKCKEREE